MMACFILAIFLTVRLPMRMATFATGSCLVRPGIRAV
jgi:hypothetical protein